MDIDPDVATTYAELVQQPNHTPTPHVPYVHMCVFACMQLFVYVCGGVQDLRVHIAAEEAE